MAVDAMERCAYCREHVPVTWLAVPSPSDSPLAARVAVCDDCQTSGL